MTELLKTSICDLLNIEYPIVLAGMGGASTPELAAAVSNAGDWVSWVLRRAGLAGSETGLEELAS